MAAERLPGRTLLAATARLTNSTAPLDATAYLMCRQIGTDSISNTAISRTTCRVQLSATRTPLLTPGWLPEALVTRRSPTSACSKAAEAEPGLAATSTNGRAQPP